MINKVLKEKMENNKKLTHFQMNTIDILKKNKISFPNIQIKIYIKWEKFKAGEVEIAEKEEIAEDQIKIK